MSTVPERGVSSDRSEDFAAPHPPRFQLLGDAWFVFRDSTRNSLRFSEVPWNRVGLCALLALLLAAVVDWIDPGTHYSLDVAFALLAGLAAAVVLAARAAALHLRLDLDRDQDSGPSAPRAA